MIDRAAALAESLVGEVPGLRLLATSREPLGVPGEVLVPLAGLAEPASMELFVDRARAVQPGFSPEGDAGRVILDVCRRLDGLPLAVELAAARLRALPLTTLAERLDDRFRLLTGGARTTMARQQTLRAVVDWSYDLLFEDERSSSPACPSSPAAASSLPSRRSAPTTGYLARRSSTSSAGC